MNTKYAKLANGQIEYAPDSIDTGSGIKVNPSAESYLAAGWKKVVDEKLAAESEHFVAFSRYDETADTITFVYKQVKNEKTTVVDTSSTGTTSGGGTTTSSTEKGHRTFSKLKLVAALKNADKWVLVKTWLEEKSYYDFYLAAQNFSEEYPLFQQGLAALKTYARLTDDEIEAILAQCLVD